MSILVVLLPARDRSAARIRRCRRGVRLSAQRRRPERGTPGPHDRRAAAQGRYGGGVGRTHRRQLASHHDAARTGGQAARGAGGPGGRAIARRRTGRAPGAGAAVHRRQPRLGGGGPQTLADAAPGTSRKSRLLRRSRGACAVARGARQRALLRLVRHAPTAAARRPGSPTATATACAARAWPAPGCANNCRAGAARAPAGAPRRPWPRRPSAGSARRWPCAPMPTTRCRRCARCGTCGNSISLRGRAARAGCAMPGAAPSARLGGRRASGC